MAGTVTPVYSPEGSIHGQQSWAACHRRLARARRRKCYGSATCATKSSYTGAPTIGTHTRSCRTTRNCTTALAPRSCPPLGRKVVNCGGSRTDITLFSVFLSITFWLSLSPATCSPLHTLFVSWCPCRDYSTFSLRVSTAGSSAGRARKNMIRCVEGSQFGNRGFLLF